MLGWVYAFVLVCLCMPQVLEDLAGEHDLPKIIIEHRQIEKRLAGFVEYEQQEQVCRKLLMRQVLGW